MRSRNRQNKKAASYGESEGGRERREEEKRREKSERVIWEWVRNTKKEKENASNDKRR